ncbi:MAG: hypothetical protein WCC70_01145 [Candidatus Aquilonibacter sp.]
MKGIVSIVGDLSGIVQGWDEGGVFGGIEAGYDADALVQTVDSLTLTTVNAAGQTVPLITAGIVSTAIIIGVVVGLAVLFFGGSHDNPADMPDKYDEPRYGDGVANLEGKNFSADGDTWKPQYSALFGGQGGIATIEETLYHYANPNGTMKAGTPAWLAAIWNQVEPIFGISEGGAGTLSIGLGGTGEDCNNQQIVGAADTSGQVYQYTQIDAAFNAFEAGYATSVSNGQSPKNAYDNPEGPGAPPPAGADYYA